MRDFRSNGRRFARWLKLFHSDRRGATALLFGLTTVALVATAGAGVDLSRAIMARTRMSEALDAAALAIGTTSGKSQDELEQMAQDYFNANYPPDSTATVGDVQVTMNGDALDLSVSGTVPTMLLKILHIDDLPIGVSNEVVRSVTKLRVALVLDNTGSMNESDSTGTTKISALKTATHQLLTQLQAASTDPGNVQVALVPFSLTVKPGTSYVNASWVGWTDWESAPPSSMPSSSVGPGTTCPYGSSTSPYGYSCINTQSGKIATTGTYAGMICPGQDSGRYNSGRGGHVYNGCYNSVPTTTNTQTCVSVNGGSSTCNTVNSAGYTGDSGPTTTTSTSTSTSNVTVSSGRHASCSGFTSSPYSNCSCTGSGSSTVCSADKTVTNTTATTVTVSGAAPYNHTWIANDHSTWTGCIMDRDQDYDVSNTAPGSGSTLFPAENNAYCPPGTIQSMGYDWSALSGAVDAMTANGSTNQPIGFAWGWQALTQGDPLNAPSSDSDTQQVIIILSDGLNTQDRWNGNGSSQSSAVDDREALVCANAKAAGVIVYTLFVDLGGTSGNSAPLQSCASDSDKYFDLTTSGQIVTAFHTIGTQLANLHLSR